MGRMRSGQLITNPNDSRKFDGKLEKTARQIKELQEGKQTGYATPINHIFTPEEIGKMTPEQFTQNEALIMEQLRNGQCKNKCLKSIMKTIKMQKAAIIKYLRVKIFQI